jgi:hypothetical protein
MQIKQDMIAEKKVVGKTSEGNPVVMVLTHGGLYAFFAKRNNETETLGLSPHKAIGAWMAEKKDPSIKWSDGFLKSENNEYEDLKKSESDLFKRLRHALFSKSVNLQKSEEYKDFYIIYNPRTFDIGIMHKADIKKELLAKNFDRYSIVRNINLSEPPVTIEFHGEFSNEK